MNINRLVKLACAAGALIGAVSASAQFVYDNSTTYLGSGYGPGNGIEFGDQINLGSPYAQISDMSFEYFNTGGNGNEKVQVRFYMNNGVAGAPGTLLFDSGVSGVLPTGRHFVSINGLSVIVPQSFTWTAAFTGVDPSEDVGLSLYSPPTVPASGGSFVDYWERVSGTWTLKTITGFDADFGASFAGTAMAVPEPSTFAWLGVYGLVAGAAVYRRVQRKH